MAEKYEDLLPIKKDFILSAIVEDEIKSLCEEENKKPGYFKYSAIQDIPYIENPLLSKRENSAVFTLARDCLIRSKRDYHYNEVSITYRTDKEYTDKDAIILTHGNKTFTTYLGDEDVARFLSGPNELIFLTMHNHPNNSGLSIEDLAVFCTQSNIRYLGAVGHDGRLSFVVRERGERYSDVVAKSMAVCISGERIKSSHGNIFKVMTAEEKNEAKKLVVNTLREKGVFVFDKISKSDIPSVIKTYSDERMCDDYAR